MSVLEKIKDMKLMQLLQRIAQLLRAGTASAGPALTSKVDDAGDESSGWKDLTDLGCKGKKELLASLSFCFLFA